MTEKFTLLVALAAFGLSSTPAAAQFSDLGLSVEVHAGVLAPTGNWEVAQENTTLRAGVGPVFSGAVRLALPAGISTYGSLHYGLPSCEDCAQSGLNDRMMDAGFGFGAGYEIFDLPPVVLRLDLGGIVHQLSFRGDAATRRSDAALGLEAGLSGSFEIYPSLSLEPSFAWRGYSASFDFEDSGSRVIEVRYLAPRIGLRYTF